MTSELIETTKVVIHRSATPMSISQIGAAVAKEMNIPLMKATTRARFSADLKSSLPGTPGIYVWPDYKRSPMFCSRPLDLCVEEAILRALEKEPLSVKKAGSEVKKALGVVSEERVLKEVKVILPRLATSGAARRVAANRQVLIYLSPKWMAHESGVGIDEVPSLKSAILAGIARMQSGPGNYVRVDHLRLAPETRSIFDKAVIELADRGQAVLAEYSGPRPVPEEQKWIYAEDDKGELFIGVALPRHSEAQ